MIYVVFTEARVNGTWHCINGTMSKLMSTEHPIISPTFRTDARQHFEKAYLQLKEDGHSFEVVDMSEVLKVSITDWIDPEDSVRVAIDYDSILKLLNTAGKEHCAFALRSEIAAFENDESEDIWEYVSAKEYRQMDDELKKAYHHTFTMYAPPCPYFTRNDKGLRFSPSENRSPLYRPLKGKF